MPNIDSLIQTISQTLLTAPQETAYFTTLDLQYAYSHLSYTVIRLAIVTLILIAEI